MTIPLKIREFTTLQSKEKYSRAIKALENFCKKMKSLHSQYRI